MGTALFAERLRDAMQRRGFKQIDIVHAAEQAGVKLGKSHISQYVSGKTMPREDTMKFLASALGVSEAWLKGQATSPAESTPTNASDGTRTAIYSPSATKQSGEPRMRTFGKSHKLDNVLYDVRGPVADEAARMEAAGTHILKLNIGNPAPFGFRTPDEVIYDMAQQLPDTEGYSPSKGLFSARKAIM